MESPRTMILYILILVLALFPSAFFIFHSCCTGHKLIFVKGTDETRERLLFWTMAIGLVVWYSTNHELYACNGYRYDVCDFDSAVEHWEEHQYQRATQDSE